MRKIALFAAFLLATPAHSAELVLFELDGCLWCEQWKQDVGAYYADTAEGKAAPLRVVDLFDKRPEHLKRIARVRATPTFVLVEDGDEIGRIVGYKDPKEFWTRFNDILKR